MANYIDRQAAIDAVDSETVSTNPEHFKSSEKFIKFMDDADIASFGKWQWANGFNTAVVAAKIQLEKLPYALPERKKGKWIRAGSGSLYDYYRCSECGKQPKWDCLGDNRWKIAFTDFCPNCGAKMEVTT